MKTSIAAYSVLLVLMLSGLVTFGQENSSVMAQEAVQASTSATYNFESTDPDALEYHVEGAVDSVLKLIEETVEGPLTSNTTESARAILTSEFSTITDNLTGITAINDQLETMLDALVDGAEGSTSLTFTIKMDTECKPASTDCLFRIHLQR
jgi:ABC-type oligopeptide transport system substrate-binding subunit